MRTMVYISGKLNDKKAFEKAELKLKEVGFERIVNPIIAINTLPQNLYDQHVADISLALLRDCDAIYMVGDWWNDSRAKFEHAYAEYMGLEIIYEEQNPEQKKFYWRLAYFPEDYYLRVNVEECAITLGSEYEDCDYNTEITESKYKELSENFGFPENMFVKVEIA